MKKLIILFAIVIFSEFNSQTNRFVYQVKSITDTISKKSFSSILFLDINRKDVKFFYENLYEVDSVQKTNKQYGSSISMRNSIMTKRNINSYENENYVFLDTDYYKYKTTDKMVWLISSETKTEKNYHLQKATTKFGGRNWTAWFSKDIPINQGP
jgi:GLPGLI family protein